MYSEKVVPNNEYSLVKKDFLIEDLISKIAKDDKDALAELYELTKGSVYGFALSILKNNTDAEDVMQEVYIKIYENADKYNPQGKPLAWIITITKNLSYMKLRNKNTAHEEIKESDIVSNNDNIEDKMLLKLVFKCLTDEERNIVVLHANTGFKHREIAKLLELPLPTVLSKYNRAIKKLKKELEKEGMQKWIKKK